MNSKPEPLPYFDLVRWLTRLKYYDHQQGDPDRDFVADTLGEAMDAALSDTDQSYANHLYITVPDPFYHDNRIEDFLDVIIDPDWNDLVMETLEPLKLYTQYRETYSPIVLKQP